MRFPKPLIPGDKVAIVATARKISLEEIQVATVLLEKWGFVAVVGTSIGLEFDQFAGTDQERAMDFQQQLCNPEIAAIWCARGGYGTVRMLDLLDFSDFEKQLKWIIGYSDVTVLHSHIHQLGVATLHGPMPIDVMNTTNISASSMRDFLLGNSVSYEVKSAKENRTGMAKGTLVGGNLSILYSLCGSPSALDTKGKILFIEDLDEYLYHIDRMIQNLKRNDMFKGLKGLVVGGMTKIHDNSIPFGKTVKEIVLEAVQEYDFPVAFDFPAGHLEDNRPLVLGTEVVLTVSAKRTIVQF